MKKTQDKQWLSAAECAQRTGLTVRALRVYERERLVSPARSEKGWRRYGPDEIARLNTVRSLKALGLTLEQIRQVMSSDPPPLAEILDMQTESWMAKRAAADKALTRLEMARSRLASRTLSLDELCELVKELEISRNSDMQSASSIFRRLINESISPDEERAWHTWWAEHAADVAAARSARESLAMLYADLERMAQQHVDPASPEAQELVDRHHSILERSGTRERALRLMQWNPSITAKFYSLGPKLFALRPELPDPSEPPRLSRRGAAFLGAAFEASPAGGESRELVSEVRKLLDRCTDPASQEADAASRRLAGICQTHGLGDPYIYVQWLRFIRHVSPAASYGDFDDTAWAFLARASEARDGRRRSESSGLENWLSTMPTSELPDRLMERVPVIPLRDVVVFPRIVMPLFVGRQKSAQGVETAMRGDKRVLLVTQRQRDVDDPAAEDLYQVGTVANVLEESRTPDGHLKILVRGIARARIDLLRAEDQLFARVTVLTETHPQAGVDLNALRAGVMARFERYAKSTGWPALGGKALPGAPPLADTLARFSRMDAGAFADTISAHTPMPLARKQEVLEILDVRERLEYVDAATQEFIPVAPASG